MWWQKLPCDIKLTVTYKTKSIAHQILIYSNHSVNIQQTSSTTEHFLKITQHGQQYNLPQSSNTKWRDYLKFGNFTYKV